jgi:hypothetical protein
MYITLKKGYPVLIDANPEIILNECTITFPTDPVTKKCIGGATASIKITKLGGDPYSTSVPFRITE